MISKPWDVATAKNSCDWLVVIVRTNGESEGTFYSVSFFTSSLFTMPFSVFNTVLEEVVDCVGALVSNS